MENIGESLKRKINAWADSGEKNYACIREHLEEINEIYCGKDVKIEDNHGIIECPIKLLGPGYVAKGKSDAYSPALMIVGKQVLGGKYYSRIIRCPYQQVVVNPAASFNKEMFSITLRSENDNLPIHVKNNY